LKKREQEEDVDPDTEIIQLPQVEEEEDLKEILANIPEDEPEEEEGGCDKQLIIQKTKLYYKNLPFLDEELPFNQQADLMPQEWLNQINLILNDRTSLEIIKLGFYTTASFVEHAGTHWFDLKLQGYEAMLRGNPEIEEIFKIKHLSSLQEVTPEQKLLGIMLLSAVSIHRLNSAGSQLQNNSQPHPPFLNEDPLLLPLWDKMQSKLRRSCLILDEKEKERVCSKLPILYYRS